MIKIDNFCIHKTMPGNDMRPLAVRERHFLIITELYLRGWTQCDIAEYLGITQSQVSYDFKKLRRRHRKSQTRDSVQVERELAAIDRMEEEAWRAFFRSCKNKRKVRVTKNSKGEKVSTEVTSEQRDGSPAWLETARRCSELRCKLKGLLGREEDETGKDRPKVSKVIIQDARVIENKTEEVSK